jgi:cytochrome c-type biogenesis protein
MFRKSFIGWIALSLLAGILTGCVAKPSPEEAIALTATAASHMVSTRTPAPPGTATPGSQAQPTEANTATPAPSQSQILSEDAPASGAQAGQLAPDFTLRDAAGVDVSLSDYRGQPVAMIFWASWCPYCRQEMPLLQNMYETYNDQGLVVVGVDLLGSKGETQEKALEFVGQEGITFPILFDESGQVFSQYQGRGVPNLIFVDQEGVIVSTYPGAMDEQNLQRQIQQLVGVQ